jgi:FkbM family methyltransferase
VVAVGERGRPAVLAQLEAAGERNPVWTLSGFELCGDKLDHAYFETHEEEFEEAYALLEDEQSRRVFVNVLNARLTGDFGLFDEVRSSRRNFDPEVLTLSGDDVLVDVGAYLGDGVLAFCEACKGRYERVIAFEPDPATAVVLRHRLAARAVRDVEVHAVAAWSERTTLSFNAGRAGSSRVTANGGDGAPGETLEADTIDAVLRGRRMTHVFMDVEGAEHAAILGAAEGLRKWRPQLAISAYHRREDLFDLPLLLRSIVPGYRFYLRHYTGDQTETVLYGV